MNGIHVMAMIEAIDGISVDIKRLACAIEKQNEIKEIELGIHPSVEIKDVAKEFMKQDVSSDESQQG